MSHQPLVPTAYDKEASAESQQKNANPKDSKSMAVQIVLLVFSGWRQALSLEILSKIGLSILL